MQNNAAKCKLSFILKNNDFWQIIAFHLFEKQQKLYNLLTDIFQIYEHISHDQFFL